MTMIATMIETITGTLVAGTMATAATPPPIAISSGRREETLVQWSADTLDCPRGFAAIADGFYQPAGFITRSSRKLPDEIAVRFDLDAEGRPTGIALAPGSRLSTGTADILPSLAASRFETQGEADQCILTYTVSAKPVNEAAVEDLARRAVLSRGRMSSKAWARISPGNCHDKPRPKPLVRHYPDFRELDTPPGRRDWSYVGYDLDDAGVPVNLRVLASSGSDTLDQAALVSVANSRMAGANRTGCAKSYWSAPGDLFAPPMPEKSRHDREPKGCDVKDKWERSPTLTYPDNYRRRAIHGWAIVRYDVAPWGELGNIEVVEAQPTAQFGQRAEQMLKRARYKPQDEGLVGCIARVRYKMAEKPVPGMTGDTDGAETD